MARREVIDCGLCGAQELPVHVPIAIRLDWQTTPAGDTEPSGFYNELCAPCAGVLIKELSAGIPNNVLKVILTRLGVPKKNLE